MKLWIDDLRPAPTGWRQAWSTEEAISDLENYGDEIEVISLDHDAGGQVNYGGDFINVLKWLEFEVHVHHRPAVPAIHIHTGNPVGAANMRRIINHNGWKETYTV